MKKLGPGGSHTQEDPNETQARGATGSEEIMEAEPTKHGLGIKVVGLGGGADSASLNRLKVRCTGFRKV